MAACGERWDETACRFALYLKLFRILSNSWGVKDRKSFNGQDRLARVWELGEKKWRSQKHKSEELTKKANKAKESSKQSTMTKHSDGDDANKTVITLKGSVTIVADFFFTAINSILYQRGTFCRPSERRRTVFVLSTLSVSSTMIWLRAIRRIHLRSIYRPTNNLALFSF